MYTPYISDRTSVLLFFKTNVHFEEIELYLESDG